MEGKKVDKGFTTLLETMQEMTVANNHAKVLNDIKKLGIDKKDVAPVSPKRKNSKLKI